MEKQTPIQLANRQAASSGTAFNQWVLQLRKLIVTEGWDAAAAKAEGLIASKILIASGMPLTKTANRKKPVPSPRSSRRQVRLQIMKALEEARMLRGCTHYCEEIGSENERSGNERIRVNIDLATNWAQAVDIPEHGFPVYKSCCHFFDSAGQEIDFSEGKPRLLV